MSKKRFDINKYKDPEFSMCCDTKEKAKTFLKYLDRIGRKWNDGRRYLEDDSNMWGFIGHDLYFFFNKGLAGFRQSDKKDGVTLFFDMFDWTENDSIKVPKIEVSKWFYIWINERKQYERGYLITLISPCRYHSTYEEYLRKNHLFKKEQYQEIRDRFEDYVRAILDGEYELEVEEGKTPLGWIPEEGEEYWFTSAFEEEPDNYTNTNTCQDKNAFEKFRVFKSKEEAEFEAEKMKVTRKLEKYAREFIEGDFNYYIYANNSERAINFYCMQTKQLQGLCFESKEKAREAIKAVGEDRILKYYFGVEI